jgi:hypothetical protein
MNRLGVFAVGLALLAVGCTGGQYTNGDPGKVVALGEEFTLAREESAVLEDRAFAVRFLGVVHDSRCPVNVQCISAGNAVVRLRLSDSGLEDVELNTTVGPKEATQAGYTVHLVALRPETTAGRRIRQGMYRAVLRVTKG